MPPGPACPFHSFFCEFFLYFSVLLSQDSLPYKKENREYNKGRRIIKTLSLFSYSFTVTEKYFLHLK
jgi:hypothetical protein